MQERHGKWNTVYVRFRRWAEQDVWDALLPTLVDPGLTDDWQHMIDSTSVRGHVAAAGEKGEACANARGRSRSSFSSRIRARCDNQGLLAGFILTAGEASDNAAAEPLMKLPLPKPKAPLAGKGSDGDHFRESLPIIPPRTNRKVPEHPDYRRYWDRNRPKRMFGKLKQQRRFATCCDKTILSFESQLNLAAARLWLKFFVSTAWVPKPKMSVSGARDLSCTWA